MKNLIRAESNAAEKTQLVSDLRIQNNDLQQVCTFDKAIPVFSFQSFIISTLKSLYQNRSEIERLKAEAGFSAVEKQSQIASSKETIRLKQAEIDNLQQVGNI
jgi:hypothetical protein